uniref:Anaphase-promoting complex subunit 4-like WD40 domain-containing protein n=1 Tax=Percolomonas cosmopolitus TaxID=63605 RepID=A0A7S1KTR9_9EUKA|mmetsp:Transcript_8346/g.30839  ORF Transcript_8346/g.30839 Transcript_8346/m.30839 type:complete len:862 (+) Transcript_8346:508-3093(+)|eukprot:CAMPEP_0117439976 /NCGR_PEP_ID=MMETSP0759-20121206/2838_1 /TAXON_ID=63605 /ORGANISM="Percolomonas cosmopolitus, Strain WS" /LENGTH=861 /DNA_ID=CAMNT_0005231699 /DNA_START=432 /DNA_END=3017 /DNA_ORIENTATION=-
MQPHNHPPPPPPPHVDSLSKLQFESVPPKPPKHAEEGEKKNALSRNSSNADNSDSSKSDVDLKHNGNITDNSLESSRESNTSIPPSLPPTASSENIAVPLDDGENQVHLRTIHIAPLSCKSEDNKQQQSPQQNGIIITPTGMGHTLISEQPNDLIPPQVVKEIVPDDLLKKAEHANSDQHPQNIDVHLDALQHQSVISMPYSALSDEQAFSGDDSDDEFVDCVDEIELLETPMHKEDTKKIFHGGHLEWRHEMETPSPTDETNIGSPTATTAISSNDGFNENTETGLSISIDTQHVPEEDILKGFVIKNLDDGSETTLFEHVQTPHPFFTQLAIKEREREQSQHGSVSQQDSATNTTAQPTTDEKKHIKRKISHKFTKFLSTVKHSHHVQAAMAAAGARPAGAGSGTDEDTDTSPSQQHKLKAPNHIRVQCKRKRFKQFPDLRAVESILAHDGAIWCMEFSHGGEYLATGGQDGNICLWKINKNKYADNNVEKGSDLRDKPSMESHTTTATTTFTEDNAPITTETTVIETKTTDNEPPATEEEQIENKEDSAEKDETSASHPTWLAKKPFRIFKCRQRSDVVALSWSKRNFLISSSMDHRVSVWHVSRDECLVSFKHNELVTSLAFHPEDDSLFVTGSFDEKLRLFNLRNRELVTFQDTKSMITALGFADNGKTLVAGTFDGKCIFYSVNKTEIIRRTRIDVRSRRGKNKGKKVTAVVASPDQKRILVTSNDSRIRLYSLIDYSEITKFKGLVNTSSQIKASFNADGSFVVSGSENNSVYFWSTDKELAIEKKKPLRKKTLSVDSYETFRDSDSTVTNSIFAPFRFAYPSDLNDTTGLIVATSNFKGCLTIYESLAPPESG